MASARRGGSLTIQRVGKATAAPVELDGWERLLLEERERKRVSEASVHAHKQKHGGVAVSPPAGWF